MKILLVTEKFCLNATQQDGGARVVASIINIFKNELNIMQFGDDRNPAATWNFAYPNLHSNRFISRIANAPFIGQQINNVANEFTHIIFIHIAMQFGLIYFPLPSNLKIWTLPMFLSRSYYYAGEIVPDEYKILEQKALTIVSNIITPSYLEKQQLVELYGVAQQRIYVIPRGVGNVFINKARTLNKHLRFCSVGSIKPQKDLIGLVSLFNKISMLDPNASLSIIGPVQDLSYYEKVCNEVKLLNLESKIEFVGSIPHMQLSRYLKRFHFHISCSKCETFGRTIFETLAMGIPNIVQAQNNAAYLFLSKSPYIKFFIAHEEIYNILMSMKENYALLSKMAREIKYIYSEHRLSNIIAARITNKPIIAISDFDGTLFYKNNIEQTYAAIAYFKKFAKKIICSARTLEYLLEKIKFYDLQVDWIISLSGAVVADGQGNILWTVCFSKQELKYITASLTSPSFIEISGKTVQVVVPYISSDLLGCRTETYQNQTFINKWQASKLMAVLRLLEYIQWQGQVEIFADGKYDLELLTYFDGTLIAGSDFILNEQLKRKNNIYEEK